VFLLLRSARRAGLSPEQVSRIRARFVRGGVDGLADRAKAGRKDHAVAADVIERVVQLALSPPPAGRSRWTSRLLGREVRRPGATVARILRNNGLKPHLVRKYKVSRDPEFAAKVQDVVGVYLNPPENVVPSIDEKTYTVPSMYMEWTWSSTSAITRRTFDCWAGRSGCENVGEIRDKALISFVAAPTPAARNREGSPGARALFASLTAVHVKRWM